jgi:hypothetical protein
MMSGGTVMLLRTDSDAVADESAVVSRGVTWSFCLLSVFS